MTVINMAVRKYHSELREEQARETRGKILEAAVRITLIDVDRVTHAAVAKAARVSERTVYRHFPTLRALHDAFAEQQVQRLGPQWFEQPALADLPRLIEALAERMHAAGAFEQLVKHKEPRALADARRRRFAGLEAAVAAQLPRASREQVRALALVFQALSSTEMFRRGYQFADLPPAKVAPVLAWAMRVLTDALGRNVP